MQRLQRLLLNHGSARAAADRPDKAGKMRRIAAVGIFVGGVLSSTLLGAQIHPSARHDYNAGISRILIGVSNAQSGPSRSLGQNLLRGSAAYFDIVNKQGGIYGRKIEILLKDDKYEPGPALRNTHELIEEDNVFVLFDYVGTPTLTRILPLLQYFEKTKLVNVAPLTGADPPRQPPYDKFVFNIRASYRQETRALVRYLYEKGYRRIGFFGQADSYGKSGEIGVIDALAELNLKLVKTVSYRRNLPFETDMTTQVKLLRQAGADAVIAVSVYGPCAAFIRDARMSGWDVPVPNVSFVEASVLLDTLKRASSNAGKDLTAGLINSQVVPSYEDTRYPLVKDYRAHLAPGDYGFVSLEGWLNAVVVSKALKRAGSTGLSRNGFIHAMESLHDWDPGLGVNLQFSSTSHQGLRRVWLTRTQNGRWVAEGLSVEAR
jgi:branched-chain amino acid transport system substrate-binding protein